MDNEININEGNSLELNRLINGFEFENQLTNTKQKEKIYNKNMIKN
jgi:hypothetical protein